MATYNKNSSTAGLAGQAQRELWGIQDQDVGSISSPANCKRKMKQEETKLLKMTIRRKEKK